MQASTLVETEVKHLSSSVELLMGQEVLDLISDEKFLKDWDMLYKNCPWATVYQSKEFVVTWYRIYRDIFEPILVKETNGEELIGLLPITRDENGLIVGAGCGIAEYHVWITRELNSDNFIQKALRQIKEAFPKVDIRFRFLPNGTPLKWVQSNKQWKNCCLVRSYERPLMQINEAYLARELKKKNRREKINRLKRLGDLKFERITDKQTFSAIFDELAVQYDFRKGAMFNKSVFDSPLPKQLLIELFNIGFFHATILSLNSEIIASHIGAVNKNWIHLQGLNTHSPLYAKYSPGILHFLMLGRQLAEEGFEVFDLTPGGDSYKEGLATHHDMTYELRIVGSIQSYIKSTVEKKIYDFVLKDKKGLFNSLGRIGISPNNARKEIKSAIRKYQIFKERVQSAKVWGISSLISELNHSLFLNQSFSLYKLKFTSASQQDLLKINKDNLAELLKYKPLRGDLTKWEFLSEAMGEFEEGAHVYTFSDESRLLFSIWIKKLQNISNKEDLLCNGLPEGSVILYNLYATSEQKGKIKGFVRSALQDVISTTPSDNIYLKIRSGNSHVIRTLQEEGFFRVL